METLQITLFGHVSVVHPCASGQLRLSRSTQALLAYLLLHRHLVPRDVLMDVFWVDHAPDHTGHSPRWNGGTAFPHTGPRACCRAWTGNRRGNMAVGIDAALRIFPASSEA